MVGVAYVCWIRIHRSCNVLCFELVRNAHPPDSSASMEERKNDIRVYLITGAFLICIVAGGICLCIYIFHTGAQQKSWYSIVGFILVGVPWLFWILTYCYTCYTTCFLHIDEEQRFTQGFNAFVPNAATPRPAPTATTNAPTESQVNCSCSQRRVHFGGVTVMGEDSESDIGDEDSDDEDNGEP